MRRTQRGWDPSFFWQFVNGTHGTTDCLKRVVPLVTPVFSTRSSPCCWRHSLPPFLIACGRPNQERSSLLIRPVLLLLTGQQQEEGKRVEKRVDWTPEVGKPQGSFLSQQVPLNVLGEMLVGSLSQLMTWSQVVSSSPIWTLTESSPSPLSTSINCIPSSCINGLLDFFCS